MADRFGRVHKIVAYRLKIALLLSLKLILLNTPLSSYILESV